MVISYIARIKYLLSKALILSVNVSCPKVIVVQETDSELIQLVFCDSTRFQTNRARAVAKSENSLGRELKSEYFNIYLIFMFSNHLGSQPLNTSCQSFLRT